MSVSLYANIDLFLSPNKIKKALTCCTYDTITAHPVSVASFASETFAISSTSFMLSGLGKDDIDGFAGGVDPKATGSDDKIPKPYIEINKKSKN